MVRAGGLLPVRRDGPQGRLARVICHSARVEHQGESESHVPVITRAHRLHGLLEHGAVAYSFQRDPTHSRQVNCL
jgi:hypothetical protein